MQVANALSPSVLELALEKLRDERTFCVRHLETTLLMRGAQTEVNGWLDRIEGINSALVSLANSCLDRPAPPSPTR
jgi:hypothetical protein